MSRIEALFENLKREEKKALIPFITAGDPSLAGTKKLALKAAESGADILELGVPFSDPLADGPTIQKSALRALRAGTTLKKIIQLVKDIRKEVSIPLVLMSSYNPVHAYGVEAFCRDAAVAGVDGVIIPDVPPEEAGELQKPAQEHEIDIIFLLAPTSSRARIEMISNHGGGFLYYVSLTGVTGSRAIETSEIREKLEEIRKVTDKPLCVGFGISGPEQAGEIASFSDGVIVGSAIVRMVEEMGEDESLPEKVGAFIRSLKNAI